MKNIISRRGFTLIELLVVISIIGMLASVVLVSVGSARNKAKDAAIMQILNQMARGAEMMRTNAGYPTDMCDVRFADYMKSLNKLNIGTSQCSNNATEWAADAALSTGERFCVSSTGFAGKGYITFVDSRKCVPSSNSGPVIQSFLFDPPPENEMIQVTWNVTNASSDDTSCYVSDVDSLYNGEVNVLDLSGVNNPISDTIFIDYSYLGTSNVITLRCTNPEGTSYATLTL